MSNFLFFFGPELIARSYYRQRRRRWQSQAIARQAEPRHRCAVCEIDSDSHPDMDFRYCTQCAGSPGYCTDHIRKHEHIVGTEANT